MMNNSKNDNVQREQELNDEPAADVPTSSPSSTKPHVGRIFSARTDCKNFELKRFPTDCGDCQTDGHYLCEGCKHIAPFDGMELSDNRMRYYHKEEAERIAIEKSLLEIEDVS